MLRGRRLETTPRRKDDLEMSREDRDDLEELRRRDEEQQRTIDFILEQQAQFTAEMQQFAAGMQQLREAQARAEEKWGGMWERTNAGINALLAAAQIQSHQIDGLAEAQANTNRQMAETTEKLNALIGIVDQLVSDRRNEG
jgi:chromosome segregation ATPase